MLRFRDHARMSSETLKRMVEKEAVEFVGSVTMIIVHDCINSWNPILDFNLIRTLSTSSDITVHLIPLTLLRSLLELSAWSVRYARVFTEKESIAIDKSWRFAAGECSHAATFYDVIINIFIRALLFIFPLQSEFGFLMSAPSANIVAERGAFCHFSIYFYCFDSFCQHVAKFQLRLEASELIGAEKK